jgi:hypothetical protein
MENKCLSAIGCSGSFHVNVIDLLTWLSCPAQVRLQSLMSPAAHFLIAAVISDLIRARH